MGSDHPPYPHRSPWQGEGCSKEIPARLKSINGEKPLVVTDQGIVNAGILKVITDILDAKMKYAI